MNHCPDCIDIWHGTSGYSSWSPCGHKWPRP